MKNFHFVKDSGREGTDKQQTRKNKYFPNPHPKKNCCLKYILKFSNLNTKNSIQLENRKT